MNANSSSMNANERMQNNARLVAEYDRKRNISAVQQRQPTISNRGTANSASTYDVYGKKLFAKEGGLRYDLFTGESKPSHQLDRLTIGQVKALQKKRADSAAGAYQFTLDTLIDTQKAAGLSDNDIFDAKNQYRLFETFTKGNESWARDKLGLAALNDAQRYSMHFLGRYGGVTFLKAIKENPTANFAKMFPSAYQRNVDLINAAGGRNATVRDVYRILADKMK